MNELALPESQKIPLGHITFQNTIKVVDENVKFIDSDDHAMKINDLGDVRLSFGSVWEVFDEMVNEKEDLEAAINKLRHAIASLNREGRDRLKDA